MQTLCGKEKESMSELIDLIKHHEGIRLYAYDDVTSKPIGPGSLLQGHPTIGVGRALDVNGISMDEAEFLLTNDIHHFQGELRRTYPWFNLLLAARQDAVTDLAFNVGLAGFAKFEATIAAIKRADYAGASRHMLASQWATQVGVRATDLAKMMETGEYL